MPFDFSDDELETAVEDPAEDAAPSESTIDAQMSEVEKRLEYAQYYRLLLNDTLFSDNSKIAREIEQEVRDFVRSRLGALLGVVPAEQPKPEGIFTLEEVEALKAVAGKLIKKPNIIQPPVKSEPPAINKKHNSAPALKQRAGMSQQPKAQPARQQTASKARSGPIWDGLPDRLKNDPNVYIEDGKVWQTMLDDNGNPKYPVDEHGQVKPNSKPLRRNLTGQKRAQNAKPMPDVHQFNAIMQQHGAHMVQSSDLGGKGGVNLGTLVGLAMQAPVKTED